MPGSESAQILSVLYSLWDVILVIGVITFLGMFLYSKGRPPAAVRVKK